MDQINSQSTLLARFGAPQQRVARALASLRAGNGVIVVDDDDRENEGDIIYPAETISVAQMALMIRHCSGIVCLILTDERARQLDLPQMTAHNTARLGTAFTISIDAAEGISTGVSAADRVRTIHAAVADTCHPTDLARPGHVFPIRANPGGLLARRGHTEATIELMVRAGHKPAGVLSEITNPDGTMTRLPELLPLSQQWGLPIVSIADLVADLSQGA